MTSSSGQKLELPIEICPGDIDQLALFRSKSHKFNRQEVMLFLQVTVLKTPSDAGAQARIEKSKLTGILEAFKDIAAIQPDIITIGMPGPGWAEPPARYKPRTSGL